MGCDVVSAREFARALICAIGVAWCASITVAAEPVKNLPANPKHPPAAIEFNRDIRPLLSDKCFFCHGPDARQRKAGLRLDTEAGALAKLENGDRAIVPGDLEKSELYQRLISDEPETKMPPPKSGHSLTPAQIDLFKHWILSGAKWQKHWSFIPVQRPDLPVVHNLAWCRNPIDRFVLARLEREGFRPSPEADRITLIRRLSIDLTGIPPTPEEVDRFLQDKSPHAYENAVDRLLASPRYGERMAMRWLDGARYADTSGYQTDGPRDMWRWRDWVIEAYNSNMPFDQFTIEQLAGDLLPHPTVEQRIATGFNRNHRGNAEGGIIPEEYAVEYVADRAETTATVWLGLTMMCSRCHSHKFDPLTQKDFYRLFAFFNNIPERGRALKYGNSPPYMPAPTQEQQAKLKLLETELSNARHSLSDLAPQIASSQRDWEQRIARDKSPLGWFPANGLVVHYPLDGELINAVFREPREAYRAGSARAGSASYCDGRVGTAAKFDGKTHIDAHNVADFDYSDDFSWSVWVRPLGVASGTIFSKMINELEAKGVSLSLKQGRPHVYLGVRWLDDAIRVEAPEPLPPDRWSHIAVTYDGSKLASGVKLFVNGQPIKFKVNLDELNQPFQTTEPLRIGAGHGTTGGFHGAVDELRIYDRILDRDEIAALSVAETVSALAAIPESARTSDQQAKLRLCFVQHAGPEAVHSAYRRVVELTAARRRMVDSFPTVMIMEEMPQPRDSFVLLRGEYDKRGEKVTPAVIESLAAFPASAPHNRLGLARWLMEPENPLPARVTVNRFWQMYFGTGLVKTVEDFGSQGEWPSHPELLDWLAAEFMNPSTGETSASASRRKWDVKQMQRLIVTSATYRQSSNVTQALLQRDPENRLVARGPRVRFSAEMVRDQALAASGLLVEKLGGPSVKPYQPEGLWKDLSGTDYVQDTGDKLYRRGMYTFWKRTVAPPMMVLFDSAGRETCIVRESRTNTPLQALTLMNETSFVEASRRLAERVMQEATGTDARLTRAFRLVLSRPPRPAELKVLREGWQEHLERFRKHPESARGILTVGESPVDKSLDSSELAAYTAISGLILNLDEAITKE